MTYKNNAISPKELVYKNIRYFEDILEGISVSLEMCDKENNIIFLNKYGYEYLNLKPEDILRKKCFDIFGNIAKCEDCPIGNSINKILPVKKEVYIECIKSHVECSCSPILGKFGEASAAVILIKEIIKESSKNYRKIVNLATDAMVIVVDEYIVIANTKALSVFDNPIGSKMEHFISEEFLKTFNTNVYYVMKNSLSRYIFECKMKYRYGSIADVEISSSYFRYGDRPAMLASFRDISIKNKELNEAAQYQIEAFEKTFPIEERAYMKTMYMPAKVVSGDFYYLHKTDKNTVVGILGDVSGKSFKAAMDISALNILFHEAVINVKTPYEIIKRMNKKVSYYFNERYVAALCFSFDFEKRELCVAAAGINQFVFKKHGGVPMVKTVEGQYLGMFDDIDFEECVIEFNKDDWFCFYTDGLDFIFSEDVIDNSFQKATSIDELEKVIEDSAREKHAEINGIYDDTTMILFEMR